jgi:hypothetical protein
MRTSYYIRQAELLISMDSTLQVDADFLCDNVSMTAAVLKDMCP